MGAAAPRVTLSEEDLKRAGLAVKNLDRIQRMIEFYTSGFHSLVTELLAAAEDPRMLLAKIWTIFATQAEQRLKVAFGSDITALLRESEDTMSDLVDKVRATTQERDAAEALRDMLNAQLRGARDELVAAEQASQASTAHAAEQSAKNRELEQKLRDESARRRRAEREVAEMAELPIKLSEQSRRMWELTHANDKFRAMRSELDERCSKQERSLAINGAKVRELSEKCEQQSGTIEAMETSSASANAEAAQCREDMRSAKELEDGARQSAAHANALKEQAESDLAKLNGKHQELLEVCATEESGRTAAEERCVMLESELASVQNELASTQERTAERIASLEGEGARLKESLEALTRDHEGLVAVSGAEARTQAAEGNRVRLENERLKGEAEEWKTKADEAREYALQEIGKSHAEAARLQTQLVAARSEMSGEVDKAKAEVKRLQQEALEAASNFERQLEESTEKWQEQLELERSMAEKARVEMRASEDRANRRNEQLLESLASAAADLEEARHELGNSKAREKAAKKFQQAAEGRVGELQAAAKGMNDALLAEAARVQQLQQAISNVQYTAQVHVAYAKQEARQAIEAAVGAERAAHDETKRQWKEEVDGLLAALEKYRQMAAEAGKMAVELSMENQRLKAQIAAMQAQIEELGGTPPAPPPPIDTSATLVPRNTELGPAANATLGSMRAPESAEEAERVGVKNPFAMGKQRADSQPAAAAAAGGGGAAGLMAAFAKGKPTAAAAAAASEPEAPLGATAEHTSAAETAAPVAAPSAPPLGMEASIEEENEANEAQGSAPQAPVEDDVPATSSSAPPSGPPAVTRQTSLPPPNVTISLPEGMSLNIEQLPGLEIPEHLLAGPDVSSVAAESLFEGLPRVESIERGINEERAKEEAEAEAARAAAKAAAIAAAMEEQTVMEEQALDHTDAEPALPLGSSAPAGVDQSQASAEEDSSHSTQADSDTADGKRAAVQPVIGGTSTVESTCLDAATLAQREALKNAAEVKRAAAQAELDAANAAMQATLDAATAGDSKQLDAETEAQREALKKAAGVKRAAAQAELDAANAAMQATLDAATAGDSKQLDATTESKRQALRGDAAAKRSAEAKERRAANAAHKASVRSKGAASSVKIDPATDRRRKELKAAREAKRKAADAELRKANASMKASMARKGAATTTALNASAEKARKDAVAARAAARAAAARELKEANEEFERAKARASSSVPGAGDSGTAAAEVAVALEALEEAAANNAAVVEHIAESQREEVAVLQTQLDDAGDDAADVSAIKEAIVRTRDEAIAAEEEASAAANAQLVEEAAAQADDVLLQLNSSEADGGDAETGSGPSQQTQPQPRPPAAAPSNVAPRPPPATAAPAPAPALSFPPPKPAATLSFAPPKPAAAIAAAGSAPPESTGAAPGPLKEETQRSSKVAEALKEMKSLGDMYDQTSSGGGGGSRMKALFKRRVSGIVTKMKLMAALAGAGGVTFSSEALAAATAPPVAASPAPAASGSSAPGSNPFGMGGHGRNGGRRDSLGAMRGGARRGMGGLDGMSFAEGVEEEEEAAPAPPEWEGAGRRLERREVKAETDVFGTLELVLPKAKGSWEVDEEDGTVTVRGVDPEALVTLVKAKEEQALEKMEAMLAKETEWPSARKELSMHNVDMNAEQPQGDDFELEQARVPERIGRILEREHATTLARQVERVTLRPQPRAAQPPPNAPIVPEISAEPSGVSEI